MSCNTCIILVKVSDDIVLLFNSHPLNVHQQCLLHGSIFYMLESSRSSHTLGALYIVQ